MSRFVVALATFLALAAIASAEDFYPTVVPERLQELALKFPIAGRLNIDWAKATPMDTGRYMGALASANEIAREVAKRAGREKPEDADYIAGLSAQCMWPPNKPPVFEKYWPILFTAYYDSRVRAALHEAVGPNVQALTEAIEKSGTDVIVEQTSTFFPANLEDYFTKMLNPEPLEEVKP